MTEKELHPQGLDELPDDVNPSELIDISIMERMTIALPAAALAVSLSMGEIVPGAISALLLAIALLLMIFRPDRVQRRDYKKQLPELEWAEYESLDRLQRISIVQLIVWIVIYAGALAVLFWGPRTGSSALLSWMGVGVITFVLVFFLPGFSSIASNQTEQDEQTGGADEEDYGNDREDQAEEDGALALEDDDAPETEVFEAQTPRS